MTTARGMIQAESFVTRFLDAEVYAARATRVDPDDDRYLRLQGLAEGFLYSTPSQPLTLARGRQASPGGRNDACEMNSDEGIGRRVVYAIAEHETDTGSLWRFFVGEFRDSRQWAIHDVLSVAEVDGELKIIGRDGVNVFVDRL